MKTSPASTSSLSSFSILDLVFVGLLCRQSLSGFGFPVILLLLVLVLVLVLRNMILAPSPTSQ